MVTFGVPQLKERPPRRRRKVTNRKPAAREGKPAECLAPSRPRGEQPDFDPLCSMVERGARGKPAPEGERPAFQCWTKPGFVLFVAQAAQ